MRGWVDVKQREDNKDTRVDDPNNKMSRVAKTEYFKTDDKLPDVGGMIDEFLHSNSYKNVANLMYST